MARIELQPGETFEHTHPGPSTTALVSGEIELEVQGQRLRLTPVPVPIPAGVPHVMRNVGAIPAAIECGYSPAPPEAVRR